MTTASTTSALVRCLYVSRRSDDIAHSGQIDQILRASRARNTEREITGGLLCTGSFFFQVLEGPVRATARLMQSISRDTRHSQVTPVLFESTKQRQFTSWSMGYADLPSAVALIEPLFKAPDDEHAQRVVMVLLHALQQVNDQTQSI